MRYGRESGAVRPGDPERRDHGAADGGGGDMKAGRRGYTIELNNSYFRDAVGYLKAEEEKLETPTLFDLIGGA